ncbi:amidohydrolase family protein [Streptomyces tendae]|uniref:amidohydrolase family protein n=1 Tax=Streptomyces tendae TaxID=1932 RepID=UPI00368CE28F
MPARQPVAVGPGRLRARHAGGGHVWVTPSGMEHRAEFDFVRATVGLDRVIWSTDHPFLQLGNVPDFIDGLDLTAEEQAAITHRNAERLFGL